MRRHGLVNRRSTVESDESEHTEAPLVADVSAGSAAVGPSLPGSMRPDGSALGWPEIVLRKKVYSKHICVTVAPVSALP